MKLKKSLLVGLILMSTISGCSVAPTETLYHKIHVTLNLSWETDPSIDTGEISRNLSKGSGKAELDFVFDSQNEMIAQEGYVYITNYTYTNSPCTITIPAERMSPDNYSEWVVAGNVSLDAANDGDKSFYTLSLGGFDYLNTPISVTMECGMMQPYTYDDSTIDYMLFGPLSSVSSEDKIYGIEITPEIGAVSEYSYSNPFEGIYIHTTDIKATYLGLYTKDELVGEFDEMRDL